MPQLRHRERGQPRFCRKCASELRPGTVPVAAEEPGRRPSPLLIGGVAALALLTIAALAAFALLGGGGAPGPGASPTAPSTPAASEAPTAAPSAAPTATAALEPPTTAPTPAPPTTPTILSFDAPRRADCSDPNFPSTIRLSWEVAAAEGVTLSIDGTGLYQSYAGTTGADLVPFACSESQHTYLLRTTGGSGPADSEEVVVRRR